MPFDLDATTHRFTKTDDGGVQVVVADDAGDVEQVKLIREHLSHEADRFRRGDYDDPARIHGVDMPGVRELSDGYAQVDVTYRAIDGGAEVSYATTTPALVTAIHQWFDGQLSDRGDHTWQVTSSALADRRYP